MAEVVAAISSWIAIAQIAGTITKICKFYIETSTGAVPELRAILIEISTLTTIFETLQFLAENDGGSSAILDKLSRADGPVAGCLEAVKDLEKLFPSDAMEMTGENPPPGGKGKRALAALAWPFKRERAQHLLSRISQYKTAINLAVTVELT
jgi:hypothetical protein